MMRKFLLLKEDDGNEELMKVDDHPEIGLFSKRWLILFIYSSAVLSIGTAFSTSI